jgi:DNA gyrase/topoisomerase IV subunit B
LVSLAIVGCGSSQNTTASDSSQVISRDLSKERAETVEDEQQTAMKYRLIVSFISIGEGPDFNAKTGLDRVIADWEKQKGLILKQESFPWGREGEVDYCFQLSELNNSDQQSFINEIKSSIGTSKLVQITENQPCIHKR